MDTSMTVERISVPAWAWLLAAFLLLGLYLTTMENGLALSTGAAGQLHEFFHDARHFAGVPCH